MYEKQLETDLASLFGECGATVYTRDTVPDEPKFPNILVRCDQERDCGFGDSVIVRSADMLVIVSTYRDDDPDGAVIDGIMKKVSGVLLAPGLRNRLPSENMTYHGTHVLDSYPTPDLRARCITAQTILKFTPAIN